MGRHLKSDYRALISVIIFKIGHFWAILGLFFHDL